jgi:hypothetical protein
MASFQSFARRDHAAGAYNNLAFNHRPIINYGAVTHQYAVAQSTAVEYGAVADHHIITNGQGPAIGVKV